ncbi:hypothetical protein BDV97DRAFT_220286 [Delphinella strobiligena]|nr:hypothetical protein BDV97DRAFT_220286 [Delphinella strobiligena]
MATNRGSGPPSGRVQGLIAQFGGGARQVFDITRQSIQAVAQGLRPISSLPNMSRLDLNDGHIPVDTNAPRIPSLGLGREFTVEFAPTLGGQKFGVSSSNTPPRRSGAGSFAPGDDNVFNGAENVQVTPEARKDAKRRDDERRAAERMEALEARMRNFRTTTQGQTVNEVFISSAHGRPGITQDEWVGSKVLGSGGQGVAGLWLKKSSTGRIIDRMVYHPLVI